MIADLETATSSILTAAQQAAMLRLSDFAERPDAPQILITLFGSGEYEAVLTDWRTGRFEWPTVEISDALTGIGADGAYDAASARILISKELIASHDAPERLVDVLIEELGHHIDSISGGPDSPGDEGAAFLAAVLGEPAIATTPQPGDELDVLVGDVLVSLELASSVSDSGGFEGSSQVLTLDDTNGGRLTYSYEHFFIPDRFIIRYEGATLLDTGFTGGSRSGEIEIPKGTSDEIQIRIATNDQGTAWNYSVSADTCPDITPLLINASGDGLTFNPDTDLCETDDPVTIGRTDGTANLLGASGGQTSHDDSKVTLKGATVTSSIGNIAGSLFIGDVTLNKSTQSGSITETGDGGFTFASLGVEFKSVTLLRDKTAYDVVFELPDELSGLIVDTVQIFDDALIIDGNGARFAAGGKISLPDPQPFKFLNLVQVTADDLSLEYRAQEDALRLQGKLKLDKFGKFAGINEIEADLSGENYAELRSDGQVDFVGSVKVGRELKSPTGWGLTEAELTFNTVTNEVGGSATLQTPFGLKVSPTTGKVEFEFFTDPLQLDALGLTVDNLNRPIPTNPLFFFQELNGKVDNFAENNPKDVEFSGGVGATLGPQIQGTRLGRLDVDGKATKDNLSATGTADLLTAKFSGFGIDFGTISLVKSSITSTVDWSKGSVELNGTHNVFDGFFTFAGKLKADTDFNFSTSGTATLGIPDKVPFIGGVSLANANFAISFSNDGSLNNDFIAAWSQITIRKLGFEIDATIGLRVGFDGSVSRIGSDTIPPIGSWAITAGEEYVLFSADWDNADPDAELVVILPDGTQVVEADFAANNLAILDEVSTDTSRTVIAFEPVPGTWDIEVANPTGLGTVRTEATRPTFGPTFEFATQTFVQDGDGIRIEYEAFDPDSDAEISFWYDDDPDELDGALIGQTIEMDGAGSILWDPANVESGDYFVYAIVDDGDSATVIEVSDTAVSAGADANLSISIDAEEAELSGGEAQTYTVRVANASDETARNVAGTLTLPTGSALLSSSITLGGTGEDLTFDLGDLGPNGSIEFTLEANASIVADTTGASIDAAVFSDAYDEDISDNYDFAGFLISAPTEPLVDLEVTPIDLPGDLALGDDFSAELRITNNGPNEATDIRFDGFVQNSTTLAATSGFQSGVDRVISNIGTLASGESTDITVTGTLFSAGTQLISGSVSSNETDIDLVNNEFVTFLDADTVAPEQADVSLSVSAGAADDDGVVQVVATIRNDGPGIASNLRVQVAVPNGALIASTSLLQGTFDPTTLIWDIGNIRDDLSRDLILNIDIDDADGVGGGDLSVELIGVDENDPDSAPGNGIPGEDDQASVTLVTTVLPPPVPEDPTVPVVNLAPTDIQLDDNEVAEDARPGDVVGTVLVLDPTVGDRHSLSLINDAGGRFALNGQDIVIASDGPSLDFESFMSHEIIIQARDLADNRISRTLEIDVTNVNEVPVPTRSNFLGTDEDDTLIVTDRNAFVNGRDGDDLAVVEGNFSDYSLIPTLVGSRLLLNETDGQINLVSIEALQFDDVLLRRESGESEGSIFRFYEIALDRVPDVPGGTYWVNLLESGDISLGDIADAFAGAPEFVAIYGPDLDNAAYVDILYDKGLERESEPAGKAFWTDTLESGAIDRGDALIFFSESDEAQSIYADRTDEGIWLIQ